MQGQPTIAGPPAPVAAGTDSPDQRRELAIKRIREKNDFKVHLVVYAVVNTMLVVVWAATGAGYFWPIFVMAFWGIGVVMHGYTTYKGNVVSEEQIQREMQNLPR